MADNDRFVIKKVSTIDCYKCKHKIEDCEDIECLKEEGKTRAEYKNMITEVLVNEKIIKSGRGLNNHTIGEIYDIRTECKKQAKAVVDRLFGEGL